MVGYGGEGGNVRILRQAPTTPVTAIIDPLLYYPHWCSSVYLNLVIREGSIEDISKSQSSSFTQPKQIDLDNTGIYGRTSR